MLTSGMLFEYLPRVTVQSNKFSWLCSVGGKFGGIKWKNVTVQYMVLFYGVILCISIEPLRLG